jgi:hypothetical protein
MLATRHWAKASPASPYVQGKQIKCFQKQAADMSFALVNSTPTAG